MNPTGLNNLLWFLSWSKAKFVFVQEHKVLEEDLADASQRVRRLGFKSVWAAANRTEKGPASGGVAIIVRADEDFWAEMESPYTKWILK